jgi:hypothetical protein
MISRTVGDMKAVSSSPAIANRRTTPIAITVFQQATQSNVTWCGSCPRQRAGDDLPAGADGAALGEAVDVAGTWPGLSRA